MIDRSNRSVRVAALLAFIFVLTAGAPAQDLEQRAEALRSQLRDIEAKESELQVRLRQLEEDLLPENIQRSVALIGTTRPEELRARRREQLERERDGVRRQLEDLAGSRARLESGITRLEAEADRARTAAVPETAAPTTQPVGAAPGVPSVEPPRAGAARRPARRARRRVRARRARG